ncbi:hypothetical protein AGMMS49960_16970 [Betaproteobacteria bacterium]|nr:hypothetical protein AGMMS49543_00040 [Betaproteobacteria bacterium]GHU03127.1 hypothetical protein AGMMS49960_16970 [Betaproteobacteria bacterium]GHU16242.1 hypothetical protein AGMMS50243_01890 [Betaproteobacteria bacterium]
MHSAKIFRPAFRPFFHLLCLALLSFAPFAHAGERPKMAKYGAAYAGPELLWVYVAHNKADDHAVVKLEGINHPLDGHVFWTEIRYYLKPGHPERITYVAREKNAEQAVFYVSDGTATLYLPNWHGQERAEIKLAYSRDRSAQTQPEHLLTDYERQTGKIQ